MRIGEMHKRWTSEEKATLIRAISSGATAKRISELLPNRSYTSINQQLSLLRRQGEVVGGIRRDKRTPTEARKEQKAKQKVESCVELADTLLGVDKYQPTFYGLAGDYMEGFRVVLQDVSTEEEVEYFARVPRYAFAQGRITSNAIKSMTNEMIERAGLMGDISTLLFNLSLLNTTTARMYATKPVALVSLVGAVDNIRRELAKEQVVDTFAKYRAIYAAINSYNR